MSDDELASVNIDLGAEPETSETPAPQGDSALATEPAPEPETKPEGDGEGVTDGAQKAINKQFRMRKEAEEAHELTRRQLAAMQKELTEARGPDVEPIVPDMPDDPYADDYAVKVQVREAAFEARANWRAQKQTELNLASQQANQAQMAQMRKDAESMDSFASKAQELGVTGQALQDSGQVVAEALQYNPESRQIADMIVGHDIGPLLTQALAADPMMMDSMSRMTAGQAGMFLESTVKAKAAAMRPQTSAAPAPAETLTGGGVKEADLLTQRHPGVKIDM